MRCGCQSIWLSRSQNDLRDVVLVRFWHHVRADQDPNLAREEMSNSTRILHELSLVEAFAPPALAENQLDCKWSTSDAKCATQCSNTPGQPGDWVAMLAYNILFINDSQHTAGKGAAGRGTTMPSNT